MKKLLALICLLALTGCGGSDVDIISLEQVGTMTETELNAEFIGKSKKDIHDAWGEPDYPASGVDPTFYYILDGGSIRIVYDTDGNVKSVNLNADGE